MTAPTPLLRATEHGLYCEAGGFHVDPWRPVERAVITHAHADHARPGSASYLSSATGAALLRSRLGAATPIETLPFGEQRTVGDVRLSLHPAGHVLGSAQVLIEHAGERWCVSGDYKTEPDPTAETFDPVRCNVFITESTFGLPIYRWPPAQTLFSEINRWWADCQSAGRTAIIYAYALGKAQRLLAGLDASLGPILAHGAITRLNPAYAEAGVALPAVLHANKENAKTHRGRAIVVAPPSAGGTPWIKPFGTISEAIASGWMLVRGRRRRRAVDRGFPLSDHADWPGLLDTIAATGAERVGVTHGSVEPMVRYLREQRGVDAFAVETRYAGEQEDDAHTDTDPDPGPGPDVRGDDG